MKRWHEFEQERLIKSERWLAAGGRFASNSYVPVKSTVKEMEIVKDYNTSPVKPDYHGDPSTDVMPEQENNSGTKARGL
jgi:hypothetical protein